MAVKCNQTVAIEQPQQPGMIDPGGGPLAVAAEQVERPPAERRCDGAERAIEEAANIIDEGQPALRRHVARRTVGMQPGATLGPGAQDVAVILDDRGTFFLGLAPTRRRDLFGYLSRLATFAAVSVRS